MHVAGVRGKLAISAARSNSIQLQAKKVRRLAPSTRYRTGSVAGVKRNAVSLRREADSVSSPELAVEVNVAVTEVTPLQRRPSFPEVAQASAEYGEAPTSSYAATR